MKATTISNALSCRATEIIPLADISDVYNIATGRDANEFIIRKIRHGTTLYFTSQARDAIVKVGYLTVSRCALISHVLSRLSAMQKRP